MRHIILVPLDGSPLSETALPIAADIAHRSGAMLQLVHVAMPAMGTPIFVEGLPVIDEHLHSLRKQHGWAYLAQIRDRLTATGDLSVTVAVLDPYDMADDDQTIPTLIARRADRLGADLIVMTTHGRGGFARFWLGSVADVLVRLSPVPILLLRADESMLESVQPVLLQQILIPLDGSARSEAVVAPALALGKLFGATYTLLRVVVPAVRDSAAPFTTPNDVDPDWTREDQAAAQRELDTVAQRLEHGGIAVQTRVLVADKVAPAILEESRHAGSDLIAMSTVGRSGLRRLLIGSVADKVLRRADVPLLLHRDAALGSSDV